MDNDLNTKETVSLDGVKRESLVDPKQQKTVTWGPFENPMKVQLTFYHKQDGDWKVSTIKKDKMKEVGSCWPGDALDT